MNIALRLKCLGLRSLEGVPSEILDPVNTKAYQDTLLKLASLFKKNFDGFTAYKIGGDQKLTEEVVSAGPFDKP
ncbi:unnamed protein product [Sphenostylis stenocarpa]|uniref:Uncharacterized protein n=1 Tax=Sphenostylis stenocarpa TaxID=92480 RepID=A0AA86SW95_9FABA|nr:unnamed protein product [Sphenostylis stenocarpa]